MSNEQINILVIWSQLAWIIYLLFRNSSLKKKLDLRNKLLKQSCELMLFSMKAVDEARDETRKCKVELTHEIIKTRSVASELNSRNTVSDRIVTRLMSEIRLSTDDLFFKHCEKLVKEFKSGVRK